VGGLPSIPLQNRSVRPIPELIGPAIFKNDRTDYHVSPEVPVEAHVVILEEKRSPRPIPKSIGPIDFFEEQQVRGRGRPVFLEGGVPAQKNGRGYHLPETIGKSGMILIM